MIFLSTGPNEVNRTWIYSTDEVGDSSFQPDLSKSNTTQTKNYNGSPSLDNIEHPQTLPYSHSQGNSNHKQHSMNSSNHVTDRQVKHQLTTNQRFGPYGKVSPSHSYLGPSHANSRDCLHLPLKEYELPSFLKENGQVQRISPGGSPVIQRHLRDFDVEVNPQHHPHSGLMIPADQLKVPEFLQQKTVGYEKEKRDRILHVGQTSRTDRTTTEEMFRPKARPREQSNSKPYSSKTHQNHTTGTPVNPRKEIASLRNVSEVNDNKMYQLTKSHLAYVDRQQEQELPHHKSVDSLMVPQIYNERRSSVPLLSKAQVSAVANDLNVQLKFKQSPSVIPTSRTNGHVAKQIPSQMEETSVDNSIVSAAFDDASLQRKYKRRNKRLDKQYPQDAHIVVQPPGNEPNEHFQASMNNHLSLTDSESLQSNSSHSFSHSYSHQPERTENNNQSKHVDWLGVRVSSSNRLSPRATKLVSGSNDFCQTNQELNSASAAASVAMHEKSLGYVDSSFDEDSSNKVKRTDSLQAQLRKKLQKYEAVRTCEGGNRERHDSDSTTISGASFLSDSLPQSSSRKSGINDLPDDLLMRILNYLPTAELCKSSGVCRKWHYLCWDPELWTCITIVNYQDSNINRVLKNLLSKLAMRTQGYCLTVQSVKLNGCELLSDKALGLIAQFCIDIVQLEVVGCCCITSKGLQDILTKCQNLSSIDLTGCSCVNSIFGPMANGFSPGNHSSFLQLRYLNLSDCVAFDDLGLRTVGLCCGLLENLYLRRCNRVTDVGIKHIANHCLMLKELSVSDCYKVRDFSLKEVSKHMSGLKYLSVAKCPVTDTGVKCIGKRCVKLKYLNVRGCEAVSDVGIIHVVQNCLKLRSLDIGKCSITDSSLQTIAIHCPQLKKLSLKGCAGITDAGTKSVAAQCCSLQYLNVQECNLDYETFAFIREHCRNCIIEHTCPAFF